MDTPDNGASHAFDDLPSDWEQPGDDAWQPAADSGEATYQNDEAEEMLGSDLAAYAFLREDDDREVRLYFRDAPAAELALAFRKAGALLLSIAGERALTPAQASPISAEQLQAEPQGRKRRKRKSSDPDAEATFDQVRSRHTGELTVRYFYVLEDVVYTIIIASSTGVIESIAGIYPQATLSEQELQSRFAAIFRNQVTPT